MNVHWLSKKASLDYFVFRAAKSREPRRESAPAGTHFHWWTPAWTRVFPPHHRNIYFLTWWLLDRLRVFQPGQYAVLVITDDTGGYVGRVCIMPTWWRTPFIGRGSVHLSGIETAGGWRRRGVALSAVEHCLEQLADLAGDIFYIARAANMPSHDLAHRAGLEFAGIAHKTPDNLLGQFRIDNAVKPWRVVVVQAWGMGDAIMTISLLRLIRDRMPGTHITVVVGGHATGELLHAAGLADDIVCLPQRSSAWRRIRTFIHLRAGRFDCAFVATGLHWGYVQLARWIAGIPRVIGDRRMLQGAVRPGAGTKAHRFIANGRLLQPVVLDLTDEDILRADPFLPPPAPSESALAALKALNKNAAAPLYAIHLGSGGQNVKRVPPELALSIVERLAYDSDGARFLYIEGPDDPPFDSLPARLRQQMTRIANWSTEDIRWLLYQSDAVLSGDTGVGHLTATSGGRAVVLAGPTGVDQTRPWGAPHAVVRTRTPPACMPCYGTKLFNACPNGTVCMTSITPEDAVAAMKCALATGVHGDLRAQVGAAPSAGKL